MFTPGNERYQCDLESRRFIELQRILRGRLHLQERLLVASIRQCGKRDEAETGADPDRAAQF